MTTTHYPAIIVGGGQAGLSISYHLYQRNIDHIIFERDTLVHDWKDARWDNFTLVTPNWQCRMPNFPYDGNDPHGFMTRDEVYQWLQRFIASYPVPVHEHTTVISVSQGSISRTSALPEFIVETTHGTYTTNNVVIATGGYHTPYIPDYAKQLPATIYQIPAASYRNPAQLPPGEVLVVGSGQSGTQIAEDLMLAGKTVHLATGNAPRVSRSYRGKDCMTWLYEMGIYNIPIAEHPGGVGKRENTNHYVTGRDGGRDIDLRDFALQGMQLYGNLCDANQQYLTFTPNLAQHLDYADSVAESIKNDIDTYIAKEHINAPLEDRYVPVWKPENEITTLDLTCTPITSIIWCTGFRTDYRWVKIGVFDGRGFPCHNRGVTTVPGIFFLGLPWLHNWGSGRFLSIASDAEFLAEKITSTCSLSFT